MNAATSIGDRILSPRPGDLTICLYCAAILTFRDDLAVRSLLDHELDELEPNIRTTLETASKIIRDTRAVLFSADEKA